MPDPRPHQVAATQKIIFDRRCGGKLLLVVRTGASKTHVARLTAAMVGGIAVSSKADMPHGEGIFWLNIGDRYVATVKSWIVEGFHLVCTLMCSFEK